VADRWKEAKGRRPALAETLPPQLRSNLDTLVRAQQEIEARKARAGAAAQRALNQAAENEWGKMGLVGAVALRLGGADEYFPPHIAWANGLGIDEWANRMCELRRERTSTLHAEGRDGGDTVHRADRDVAERFIDVANAALSKDEDAQAYRAEVQLARDLLSAIQAQVTVDIERLRPLVARHS